MKKLFAHIKMMLRALFATMKNASTRTLVDVDDNEVELFDGAALWFKGLQIQVYTNPIKERKCASVKWTSADTPMIKKSEPMWIKDNTPTFNKDRLIFVGQEQDFNPRDLEDYLDGYPGTVCDDIYVDPLTGKFYRDCYILGKFMEYTSGNKIMYVK